jgi:hypothetical protein
LWGGLETWTAGDVALLGLRTSPVRIAGGWRLLLEAEVEAEGRLAREVSAAIRLTPGTCSGESLGTERKLRLAPGRQRIRILW